MCERERGDRKFVLRVHKKTFEERKIKEVCVCRKLSQNRHHFVLNFYDFFMLQVI